MTLGQHRIGTTLGGYKHQTGMLRSAVTSKAGRERNIPVHSGPPSGFRPVIGQLCAKRITIQEKDMQCLRDLWATIDPLGSISQPSQLSKETCAREAGAATRRTNRLCDTARAKAAQARAQGREVD
jgi:hypothetical protein